MVLIFQGFILSNFMAVFEVVKSTPTSSFFPTHFQDLLSHTDFLKQRNSFPSFPSQSSYLRVKRSQKDKCLLCVVVSYYIFELSTVLPPLSIVVNMLNTFCNFFERFVDNTLSFTLVCYF